MLTIRRTRVLRGPNIWAPVPVIVLECGHRQAGRTAAPRDPRLLRAPHHAAPVSAEARRATVGLPRAGLCPPAAGADRPRLAEGSRGRGPVFPRRTRRTDTACTALSMLTSMRMLGGRPGRLAVRLLNHLLYGSEPTVSFADELANEIIRADRAPHRRSVPRHHCGRSQTSRHPGP